MGELICKVSTLIILGESKFQDESSALVASSPAEQNTALLDYLSQGTLK